MKNTIPILFIASLLLLMTVTTVSAQERGQVVRLTKLLIDSAQWKNYTTALQEEIEKSVTTEPGVLVMYAMIEKDNRNMITIFEAYDNAEAYRAHVKSAHLINYKAKTKNMIKPLDLTEPIPIVSGIRSH